MSALSDEKLNEVYVEVLMETHEKPLEEGRTCALRAVADAAIAADRVARAEPVASLAAALIATGKAGIVAAPPAAPVVPEGWRVLLAHFVDAHGYASYTSNDEKEAEPEVILARAMLAATPAPSQEPTT